MGNKKAGKSKNESKEDFIACAKEGRVSRRQGRRTAYNRKGGAKRKRRLGGGSSGCLRKRIFKWWDRLVIVEATLDSGERDWLG